MTPEDLVEHTKHLEGLSKAAAALPEEKARVLSSLIRFAKERLVYVADGTNVDLWGFGEVPIIFMSPDSNSIWTYLHLLPEPLGVELETLVDLYNHWSEDNKYKEFVGEVVYDHIRAEVVESAFIFWAFASVSVWRTEFLENLNDLLVITYQQTGVGNDIKVVPVYRREDGSTFTDMNNQMSVSDYVEQEGLPDESEAIRKAFRGPMGAIEDL